MGALLWVVALSWVAYAVWRRRRRRRIEKVTKLLRHVAQRYEDVMDREGKLK